LASSSEAAVFLFLTERMRLSLSPHPQNSVIAPPAGLGCLAIRAIFKVDGRDERDGLADFRPFTPRLEPLAIYADL